MFAEVFLALNLIIFLLSQVVVVSTQTSTIECGISHNSVAFIFNGLSVGRYEYPWKAALMKLKDDGDDSTYICGGVLVDEETIITAAHCVRETNEGKLLERDLTVLLGAHNILKKVEPGRTFVSVKSIHIHDKWNPATLDFDGDIAVLKLADPVTFNKFIRPVCLASQEMSSMKNGSVAGWGIFDDGNKVSDVPRKVDIPIVDNLKCLRKSPGLIQIFWDEAFCAGKEGAGVCKGDSGSGFYVQKNGRFYLRGIVSSSEAKSCSEANLALYADIIEYKNFIEKFIKEVRGLFKPPQLTRTGTTKKTTTATTTTKPNYNNFEYHNVQSNCKSNSDHYGYICSIENLDVKVPNFRIRNIETQHESGKSNRDVNSIHVEESNFMYLPTFDDGLLTKKFPNAKELIIDGKRSSIPLNFHLTQIKSAIPSDIESFILSGFGYKIKKLPSDFLTKSPRLKKFWAQRNEIGEIDSDFFARNVKMIEVRINQNRIKQLPANLLSNLEELSHFTASENEIASIPRDLFYHNPKLERVYLYKNQITSLAGDLFMNNKNLKLIAFYDNKIKTLPPNLIANVPLLTTFWAYGNEIKEIPPNFTKNNRKIQGFIVLN